MTLEQEEHLQQLLAEWRNERKLSIKEQMDGLMGNLFEEMAEYCRATNDDEKIDALCDMCVFAFNSLNIGIEKVRKNIKEELLSPLFDPSKVDMLSLINNTINSQFTYPLNKQIYTLTKVCEKEVTEMGYNFYECMLETIKEISSRTGRYDENIHKFVKDKSDEAKAKWYKADYESCKIKG